MLITDVVAARGYCCSYQQTRWNTCNQGGKNKRGNWQTQVRSDEEGGWSHEKENGAAPARPQVLARSCVRVEEWRCFCATPRLERRHITSCNYKMPEEKRKEKEQLFLLLDMKTNQLRKSALMSTLYAAGCVGWTLPHIPKKKE